MIVFFCLYFYLQNNTFSAQKSPERETCFCLWLFAIPAGMLLFSLKCTVLFLH